MLVTYSADPITKDSAVWSPQLRAQLTDGVIDLINRSPTLRGQLNQLSADIASGNAMGVPIQLVDVSAPDAARSSQYEASRNILTMHPQDLTPVGTGNGTVSGDARFVGVLAHEMGHRIDDANLDEANALRGKAGMDERYASMTVQSEGVGLANNFVVRKEISQSEELGGPEIYFAGSNEALQGFTRVDASTASWDAGTRFQVFSDIGGNYAANFIPGNETGGRTYWQANLDASRAVRGLPPSQAPDAAQSGTIELIYANNDVAGVKYITGDNTCHRQDYATDAAGNNNVDAKTYVGGFDSAVKNEISTTTSAAGEIKATVSGQQATVSLDNANITVAEGTAATIVGNGNVINEGANVVVDVRGTGNTVNGPPPDYTTPPPDYYSPPPDYYSPPPDYYSPPPDYYSPPPDYYSPPPDYYSPPPDYYSPPPAYYSPPPDYYSPPPDYYSPPPAYYSPPPDYYSPPPAYYSPPPDYYSPPYYSPPSYDFFWPVVLDLNGNGIDLVSEHDSTATYDVQGTGQRLQTGWVGPSDGLLAYDNNGDNVINQKSEISFVEYTPGATTDLEGLAAFDTNNDGFLSAADTEWSNFGVWRDANQNGTSDAGEFQSLAAMEITSIGLQSNHETHIVNGNIVDGTASFTRADGTASLVGDVGFAYASHDSADNRLQQLVQAMAAFSPEAAGQTTLSANAATYLAPVIAANVH